MPKPPTTPNTDAQAQTIAQTAQFSAATTAAYQQAQASVSEYTAAFTALHARMQGAMSQTTSATIAQGRSRIASMTATHLAEVVIMRARAAIEAEIQVAKALSAWPDFAAMIQYGLAAARWAAIAATSSAHVGASSSRRQPKETRTQANAAESNALQSGQLAQGAASAINQPTGQITLVIANGAEQFAAYVANSLNEHVLGANGKLIASHSMRPAPSGS